VVCNYEEIQVYSSTVLPWVLFAEELKSFLDEHSTPMDLWTIIVNRITSDNV
jgi:hypothetical protein